MISTKVEQQVTTRVSKPSQGFKENLVKQERTRK